MIRRDKCACANHAESTAGGSQFVQHTPPASLPYMGPLEISGMSAWRDTSCRNLANAGFVSWMQKPHIGSRRTICSSLTRATNDRECEGAGDAGAGAAGAPADVPRCAGTSVGTAGSDRAGGLGGAAAAALRTASLGLPCGPCHAAPWADLLRRAFFLVVLRCPACGGRRRILAAITQAAVIRGILESLGLPAEPPVVAPARGPPDLPLGEAWT